MEYKVYVQAVNNFPISDWAASAYMGFKQKGTKVILFENIEEVPISKEIILVAFIEDTTVYLKKLGINPPLSINIPVECYEQAGRQIGYSIMAEVRYAINSRDQNYPIFIKCAGEHKKFLPTILKKNFDIELLSDVNDSEPVMLSEVVEFVSEYRGYVLNKQLRGIKHYLGDIRIFPDPSIFDKIIKNFVDQPVGYSIDVGVTDDGKTLLIECNDGWSLGNYGLDDKTYSTLLSQRWHEILRTGK